jgi:hypothetical protein
LCVTQPDGYAAAACLLPTGSLFPNGLVAPLAKFDHSHYRALQDADGVWWIRQESLEWHPPSVTRDFPYGSYWTPHATPPPPSNTQRDDLRRGPQFLSQLFRPAAV